MHLGISSQEPSFLCTAPWLPKALARSSRVKFTPLTAVPVMQQDLPSAPSSSCSAQLCVAGTRPVGPGAREPAARAVPFCKGRKNMAPCCFIQLKDGCEFHSGLYVVTYNKKQTSNKQTPQNKQQGFEQVDMKKPRDAQGWWGGCACRAHAPFLFPSHCL